MAQDTEIAALEARKQRLLAESEVLRRTLGVFLDPVQQACARVDQGIAIARSLRAFWPLVAGVAGVAVARKRGGLLRLLGKAWTVWRLSNKALAFWREQTRNPSQGT